MDKDINQNIVSSIVKDAERINDLTSVYLDESMLENTKRLKITRKTLENVVKWSLNGSSQKEIASNLELSEKEFSTLLRVSPALMWALSKGEELAQIYLSATAYELAIGGKKIKREVLGTVREYDENGRIQKTYQVPVETSYELPPDTSMMKFLLTSHIKNRYGDLKKALEEEEMRKVVDSLDAEGLIKAQEYAKGKMPNLKDLVVEKELNDNE